MSDMSKKRIVTAAITGAIHLPSMSEYLPITPEQIIDEGVAAAEAGAAVLHIHARIPETGEPINDIELLKKISQGIHSRSNVVVGLTTGGKLGSSTAERLAVIPAVEPELASCNAGTMNFNISDLTEKVEKLKYDWEFPYAKRTYDGVFMNTFKGIEEYITTMNAHGTRPEFEVYDLGMLSNLVHFADKGMIQPPIYVQFVLGISGGAPATIDNLLYLYNTSEKLFGNNFVWSCAAAGKVQFEMVTVAMILGGNARVGLEDNLYIGKGQLAKSNAEQVAKVKIIAEELGYELATPDEAREILRLKGIS